jgi:hypothetical protein
MQIAWKELKIAEFTWAFLVFEGPVHGYVTVFLNFEM